MKLIIFYGYDAFRHLAHITIITCVLGSAKLAEGENVNQSFVNSAVNVVAGDQILANMVVYEIKSAEREACLAKQGECNLLDNLQSRKTEFLISCDSHVYT